jgi:hypothetical protein
VETVRLFSIDDLICTCRDGTLVMLSKAVFVGIWLFFVIHLAFVKFEELLTDDQSLLRISIALWASVASLKIAWRFDSIAFLGIVLASSVEAN